MNFSDYQFLVQIKIGVFFIVNNTLNLSLRGCFVFFNKKKKAKLAKEADISTENRMDDGVSGKMFIENGVKYIFNYSCQDLI
jgi:hypothetical protein